MQRNPDAATEVTVPWDAFAPVSLDSADALSLRVSTRIGTNPDDTRCTGTGAGHSSALGLRLYYDSAARNSRFDVEIPPDPSEDIYLHSNGGACTDAPSAGVTSRFLSDTDPTGTSAKCKDSGNVSFAGGNPFSVVGVWSTKEAPAITSANTASFTVAVAGSFTVTTTGTPTPALTQSGTLPTGVSFVDNGNGTAALGGTPAAGTSGTYPLVITASNGALPNAVQNFFSLIVKLAPAITSANATSFTVGQAGTFTVTTTGVPAPTLTKAGALPAGVSFVNNGNGTATLSGTPGAGTGGTYTLTFTASNGVLPNATQSFTLTVKQAPAITSANAATFTVGVLGTFTVTTTGSPKPAITQGGAALPAGVTFVDNLNGTGKLSGTPAAGTGGVYALTFTASNGVAPNAVQNFTLTVKQAPAITSANAATFSIGLANTFMVTTTGTPAPAITRGGVALPSGVSFVNNGNGTATLSGNPAAGTAGPYALSFTASNGVSPNAIQSFTLTVSVGVPPVAASQSGLTTAEDTAKLITLGGSDVDSASLTFSIDSGPSHGSLSALGAPVCVPAGGGSTCTADVTYTPNLNYNGPASFTFTVSDGSPSAPATVSLTVTVGQRRADGRGPERPDDGRGHGQADHAQRH